MSKVVEAYAELLFLKLMNAEKRGIKKPPCKYKRIKVDLPSPRSQFALDDIFSPSIGQTPQSDTLNISVISQ